MSWHYLKRSSAVFVAALLLSSLPAVPLPALALEKEDQSIDMDDDEDSNDGSSRESKLSSRGYLGVSVQRLRQSLKRAFDIPDDVDGLLISRVYDESPADRAGLRDKDVVTQFNGRRVDDETEFTRMIRETRPGSQATITVWRDGRTEELTARLGSVSDESRRSFSWSDNEDDAVDVPAPPAAPRAPRSPTAPDAPRARFFMSGSDHGHLGVYLQDLNKDIGEYFSAPEGRGALIWQVVENSPAADAGLRAGDVVTELEGKEVRDGQDLREILTDFKAGETVSVTYRRRGRTETARVTLDEGDRSEFSFGNSPGFEQLRRLRPGQNMQMFRNRRDEDPKQTMERLQREMDRLQERMNQLKQDLERLND